MTDLEKAQTVLVVNWTLFIVALAIVWYRVDFWAMFAVWLAIQVRTSGAKNYQELLTKATENKTP